jgi:flavin-dependent dehydrogenase
MVDLVVVGGGMAGLTAAACAASAGASVALVERAAKLVARRAMPAISGPRPRRTCSPTWTRTETQHSVAPS